MYSPIDDRQVDENLEDIDEKNEMDILEEEMSQEKKEKNILRKWMHQHTKKNHKKVIQPKGSKTQHLYKPLR